MDRMDGERSGALQQVTARVSSLLQQLHQHETPFLSRESLVLSDLHALEQTHNKIATLLNVMLTASKLPLPPFPSTATDTTPEHRLHGALNTAKCIEQQVQALTQAHLPEQPEAPRGTPSGPTLQERISSQDFGDSFETQECSDDSDSDKEPIPSPSPPVSPQPRCGSPSSPRQLQPSSPAKTQIVSPSHPTSHRSPIKATTVHLTGHTRTVYNVCISPNGRFVAAASADKTCGVWKVASSELVLKLEHSKPVFTCCFATNSKIITTSPAITVWCLATDEDGEIIAEESKNSFPSSHQTEPSCCCYWPKRDAVASGTTTGALMLWTIEGQLNINAPAHHSNVVTTVATHNTKDYLLTASKDGLLQLWSAEFNEDTNAVQACNPVDSMTTNGDAITWAAFVDLSTSGSQSPFTAAYITVILAFGHDITIAKYDGQSFQTTVTLRGHTDLVTCGAFYGGEMLVSGSRDRTIRVWDIWNEDEELISTTINPTGGLQDLAVCAASDLLVTCASDSNGVKPWDFSAPRFFLNEGK
eukprot:TRINITY_DN75297_c0_g1_i1.p1 TRINITY_DN75297_c0_g1~~TRINITY_DN75297_c0_g1_i1.p1  ORF type:complete len:530 (+),score=26.69 TRINITY_DN75297_c0_g1_i1:2-1591(+)